MEKKLESKRFQFGKNWKAFLKNLNNDKIDNSKVSLSNFLGLKSLEGKTFIDIGSGSGLSSLSAMNLGANVFSFDYDQHSVECTRSLKDMFFPNDNKWKIESGSAIDENYMNNLGIYDIVYSWGVLHHTGNLNKELELSSNLVKNNGLLLLAIYNDQGLSSKIWGAVKKAYVKSPYIFKIFIIGLSYIRLWGPTTIKDFIKLKPFYTWRNLYKTRGMSPHYDVIDWVGGYPFEVRTPEEIIHFYLDKGYELKRLKTCKGGKGCNEFLFKKVIA